MDNVLSQFKVGGFYKHKTAGLMHIVGAVPTTLYGWTLVAETTQSAILKTIGQGLGYTVGWAETTEEDWMTYFSVN